MGVLGEADDELPGADGEVGGCRAAVEAAVVQRVEGGVGAAERGQGRPSELFFPVEGNLYVNVSAVYFQSLPCLGHEVRLVEIDEEAVSVYRDAPGRKGGEVVLGNIVE